MELTSVYRELLPGIIPCPPELLEIIYDYVELVLVQYDLIHHSGKDLWLQGILYSRKEYNLIVELLRTNHEAGLDGYDILVGSFSIETDPEKIQEWEMELREINKHMKIERECYIIDSVYEGGVVWWLPGQCDIFGKAILNLKHDMKGKNKGESNISFNTYSEFRDYYINTVKNQRTIPTLHVCERREIELNP